MKKLGFGLMRLPMKDDHVDIEQTKLMVDEFMANGFTYFDTAYLYCEGESECAVKECIVDRYPRDSFTVTTKLPLFDLQEKDEVEKIFNDQKRKTGLDYFDYYWLHAVGQSRLEVIDKCDCWNFIKHKKEIGEVKHIGFSFHDNAEVLDEILTKHPEVEYVQLQLNYMDWESDFVQSHKCYDVCVKHNKPVIVMEPVKGGTLALLPEDIEAQFKAADPDMSSASWAIRFAASLDNVFMVLSGMSNTQQMHDNLSYMKDFKPLNDEEVKMCLDAGEKLRKLDYIACTGCAYCTSKCPIGMPIPQYFAMFNEDKKLSLEGKESTVKQDYDKASPTIAECLECGECEKMCPQHIWIRNKLKKVAEHFGE